MKENITLTVSAEQHDGNDKGKADTDEEKREVQKSIIAVPCAESFITMKNNLKEGGCFIEIKEEKTEMITLSQDYYSGTDHLGLIMGLFATLVICVYGLLIAISADFVLFVDMMDHFFDPV